MTSAPTPERLESFVSTCRAITATSPATKTRWSTSDAARLNTRTISSTASSASGGTRVTASAKSTASWAPRPSATRAKRGSGLRARKVERSGTGCELFRAHDLEALGEALLEPVGPVVGMVSGPLPRQQSAGHRVFGRDELDHARLRSALKPVQELGDGDVAGDRDVVDECESERQVGTAAVEQRPQLLPAPAEPGRRVDDVHGQRQDPRLAFLPQRAVEPVDDEAVRVHRDDVLGALRGDSRVPALVAAEVPDEPRALLGDGVRDEAGLPLGVLGRVRRVGPVLGPR